MSPPRPEPVEGYDSVLGVVAEVAVELDVEGPIVQHLVNSGVVVSHAIARVGLAAGPAPITAIFMAQSLRPCRHDPGSAESHPRWLLVSIPVGSRTGAVATGFR